MHVCIAWYYCETVYMSTYFLRNCVSSTINKDMLMMTTMMTTKDSDRNMILHGLPTTIPNQTTHTHTQTYRWRTRDREWYRHRAMFDGIAIFDPRVVPPPTIHQLYPRLRDDVVRSRANAHP